ncbi:hypothetical protein V6N13_074178 [Hibiscus sabdariffa]
MVLVRKVFGCSSEVVLGEISMTSSGVASIGCWTELGLLACVAKGIAKVAFGDGLSKKFVSGSRFSWRVILNLPMGRSSN